MRFRDEDLLRFEEDGDLEELEACLMQASDVDCTEESGNWTALFVACLWGRTEMVRLLIEAGANVNHRADYGDSVLMIAVEHQHSAIVELLLRAGADANIFHSSVAVG